MIPYAREAGALLGLALWAGSLWLAYDYGGSEAEADAAKVRVELANARADAERTARETERKHGEAMTAIAQQHEKDRKDAQAEYARTVAGLRSGAIQLQDRWAGCVAQAGRSAAELDAAARDREESAARIVQAAREADAKIKGLQEIVRKDRETNDR